jgi:hypothetical protein
MFRRRKIPARADIFDERKLPAWLVVHDAWYNVLEARALPPGTDLLRVYLVELLRYHDDGWRLSQFSAFGAYFFASKRGELKRRVFITIDHPGGEPRVWV